MVDLSIPINVYSTFFSRWDLVEWALIFGDSKPKMSFRTLSLWANPSEMAFQWQLW